jgi:hypothetical protein
MILNFNRFCNEKFVPQPDDSYLSASDKNFFNDEEILIQRFNAFKTDLINVYKNSISEIDLMNKLFNKKYIVAKTANPKKKKFINKYLAMWSKICEKRKKIEELEKLSQGDTQDIKNYDKSISDNKGNQTVVDYTQGKKETSSERMSKHAEEVKQIESEIMKLESELKKEFELMKKKHKLVKDRIMKDEMTKKSNPAEIGEEQEKK